MTNLRSLSDLFKAAMKLAAACAFMTAIAAAASAQTPTNVLESTGNAGIGTTTPAYPLTVNQTGNSVNRLVGLANDSSGSSAQSAISFFEGATEKFKFGMNGSGATSYVGGANAFQLWHFQNAPIVFGTNSVERIRIDGSGNVGIGTTSPTTFLDVSGGLRLRQNPGGNSAASLIEFGDRHSGWGMGVTWNLYYNGSAWKYRNTDFGAVLGFGDGTNQGDLVYWSAPSAAAGSNSSLTERMRITNSGSVGIGTSAPSDILHVGGGFLSTIRNEMSTWLSQNVPGGETDWSNNAYYSSGWKYRLADEASQIQQLNGNIRFFTAASGTAGSGVTFSEKLTVLQGGNVGIGTASPGQLLSVAGTVESTTGGFKFPDGSVQTTAASGGGSGGSTAFSNITAGTNTVALVVGNGGSFGVSGTGTINATSLANAANISSGTVPIARLGTGTPDSTKFLRGDNTWTAITSSQWTTGTGNISYTAGNVGIGVAPNSSYKLDVAGNINSSGTITGNIINAKYQDLAEWVLSTEELAAATVVVLDPTKENQVISSTVAYDTRVAGVISEQPGITLGEGGAGKVLVATTGRVFVKVDASRGPIQIGDLLVTSDIPGVAMRSDPVEIGGRKMHMPGTIIGKALAPLPKGRGQILVLLSLQ